MHFSFLNNWCISILGLIILEVWEKYRKLPPKHQMVFPESPSYPLVLQFWGSLLVRQNPFNKKTMTELGGVSFFNSLTCCWEQPNKGLASPSNLRNDPKIPSHWGWKFLETPIPGEMILFDDSVNTTLSGAAFALRCEKWTHGSSEEKPGESGWINRKKINIILYVYIYKGWRSSCLFRLFGWLWCCFESYSFHFELGEIHMDSGSFLLTF